MSSMKVAHNESEVALANHQDSKNAKKETGEVIEEAKEETKEEVIEMIE